LPTDFYANAQHPERCVVGHPFNPVYLLPLVEVVGGVNTSPEAIQAAMQVYRSLSMRPLHVRKEVPGFIADRLLEAMWRESLHLVNDGVAEESSQFGSYEAAMGFASNRYPELEQERQPYARGREEEAQV
jgi:3-hydroxyacyl-CoA dehydrogenase